MQALLFWIIGELVLNIGQWKWVGWLAIVYGWLTFISALVYAGKYAKEIKQCFNKNGK